MKSSLSSALSVASPKRRAQAAWKCAEGCKSEARVVSVVVNHQIAEGNADAELNKAIGEKEFAEQGLPFATCVASRRVTLDP